jgi:hypothetical protein
MACFHQSKSTGKKDVQSNFEVWLDSRLVVAAMLFIVL